MGMGLDIVKDLGNIGKVNKLAKEREIWSRLVVPKRPVESHGDK